MGKETNVQRVTAMLMETCGCSVGEAKIVLKECLNRLGNRHPFQMTNHEIGCTLEGYTDIIDFRGFKEEAKLLENIASRLK